MGILCAVIFALFFFKKIYFAWTGGRERARNRGGERRPGRERARARGGGGWYPSTPLHCFHYPPCCSIPSIPSLAPLLPLHSLHSLPCPAIAAPLPLHSFLPRVGREKQAGGGGGRERERERENRLAGGRARERERERENRLVGGRAREKRENWQAGRW
jgi:hypothetical protein